MNRKKFSRILWLIGGIIVIGIFLFNPLFYILDSFINKTKYNEQDAIIDIIRFVRVQYYSVKTGQKCEENISNSESPLQSKTYNFEIKCNNNSFQIWAVPKIYGREGRKSFYLDSNDGRILGADHKGEKATANDAVIRKVPDEWKEYLK